MSKAIYRCIELLRLLTNLQLPQANRMVRERTMYLLQWARPERIMATSNFPIKELRSTGPASRRRIWNLAAPHFGLILQEMFGHIQTLMKWMSLDQLCLHNKNPCTKFSQRCNPSISSHLSQLISHRREPQMAENLIRFGIVGCAEIARKVARAINSAPNSAVSAIASRSLDKALNFAAVNGLPETVKVYGSYHQILDDPCVDAVYMPLPTSLHRRWAILAAEKKKHILLEKPTALDVEELDQILDACESNGVQFMDGSMWLHHPRTAKVKEIISDPKLFGHVNYIHSTSTTSGTKQFLEENIRVKSDLDALGALGDLAWYCIGALLWAKDYELPIQVRALPDVTKNKAGVILSCTATLHWGKSSNETSATIHCSFLSHTSMDITISGTHGSVNVYDFIIPYQETSASFDITSGAKFAELHIGWNTKPEEIEVVNELPQEALMIAEFSRLVQAIRTRGSCPDSKWPQISRKTQVVMDAVKKSIDTDCRPVYL